MKEAQSNYNIAIKDLVYRPGISPLELVTIETAKKVGEVLAETCAKVQESAIDSNFRISSFISEQTIRYAFIL
jgi:phytoene desaturase